MAMAVAVVVFGSRVLGGSREGGRAEAHGDLLGVDGELREGLRHSGRRGGSPATAVGDELGEGRWACLATCGEPRRSRTSRRSSQARRGVEGEAVASTTAAAAYGRVGHSGRGRGRG